MKPLRLLSKLVTGPTPRVARDLRNFGLKLTGGGAAILAGSATLPDVPDSWLAFARSIVEIISALSVLVGTIATIVGQSQTRIDPNIERELE